jgi:phage terminase Nu1 subunit (DNA packaging protein)
MIVNRTELAKAFNKSPPTIDVWVADGCPIQKKSSKGVAAEFVLPDVIAWYTAKAVSVATGTTPADESELKLRRLKAETEISELNREKTELDLAKAKGEVSAVRDFERAQASIFATIRQNVLMTPANVASSLMGCTDESEFKRVMVAALKEALESAANADIELDDEEETT